MMLHSVPLEPLLPNEWPSNEWVPGRRVVETQPQNGSSDGQMWRGSCWGQWATWGTAGEKEAEVKVVRLSGTLQRGCAVQGSIRHPISPRPGRAEPQREAVMHHIGSVSRCTSLPGNDSRIPQTEGLTQERLCSHGSRCGQGDLW